MRILQAVNTHFVSQVNYYCLEQRALLLGVPNARHSGSYTTSIREESEGERLSESRQWELFESSRAQQLLIIVFTLWEPM